MQRTEADGHVLTWERGGDGARLTVAAGRGRGGGAMFVVRTGRNGLRVELALPPTSRTVDVSLQPGIFTQVLPVDTGPCPVGSAGAAVADWLADLARDTGAWHPHDATATGLVGVAGGTALPLLGAVYDAGATVLGEVPRWAAPVLAAATPREAARAGWGVKGTRTVARALAVGLVVPSPDGAGGPDSDGGMPRVGRPSPTGGIGLHRLAAALMGEPVLEPDRLARVLTAGGPPPAPARLPDVPTIAAGRELLARLGPVGAERVLSEALASPRGMEVLGDLCRLAPGVRDQLPARPPGRLDALVDLCRGLLPLDPDPSAARFGPVPPSPTGRVPRPAGAGTRVRRGPSPRIPTDGPSPAVRPPRPAPARDVPLEHAGPPGPRHRARTAPAAPAVPANTALRPAPRVAALHGAEVGDDLRLVVPRTSDELVAWGRILHSCVGSFGPAVAAGRSVLVGVEREGRLAWCLEATPEGTVRQFLGERNRPVPPPVAAAVCVRLVSAGVLVADRGDTRLWLGA